VSVNVLLTPARRDFLVLALRYGLAVASYTAALFLLSHFWVFAHTPNSGKDA
jgi:hypothetical protein